MGRLDTFVAPQPKRWVIRAMTPVNRVFMLGGIPLLRDVPLLRRVPGIRGVTNIRVFDFPAADQARLAVVCGAGKATFVTPNHPEFFTDWMIDKEVLARVSPWAAAWATHGVVNGLGRAMQKFWLANNLIAQIPGNAGAAREHSVTWSLTGNGVLLHPEGAVGWHADTVAPLLPGAAEMAGEALERGRWERPGFQAWVAPVVWKLVFLRDVERELAAECAYVEKRLRIAVESGLPPPRRVYRIYEELLARAEARSGLVADRSLPFSERHEALITHLERQLSGELTLSEGQEPQRVARRWLRENRGHERYSAVKALSGEIALQRRIGPFAFANPLVTQEELAEHLKRIRNDYCAGTLRDTLNRFVPQPAAPRRAILRVPEPIGLHAWQGSAAEATEELRRRMQAAIDTINAELASSTPRVTYPNPFHAG
ncbi:MAG: hypothetical protein JNL61_01650 [Rhizobiaceae bacterium]|nr:hypothetical protein [Rhizobiaceae bacterium]